MAPAAAKVFEEEDPQQQVSKYMKGVRHLCDSGVTTVPTKYIWPVPERPSGRDRKSSCSPNLKLPIIDLSQLESPNNRQQVLNSLAKACEEYGFFQIVNHGIPENVVRSAIDAGRRFFEQPFEDRVRYMSADVRSPVRYGTSFNQTSDRVFSWRDFLKLNCHPMSSALPHWPSSPADFREATVSYATHSRNLFTLLASAVVETLGLKDTSILQEFEEGTQLMIVNCFPTCPEPDLTLGMPPHSDYGFLTVVLQDGVKGLQIQCKGEWITIEPVPNSLVVNVGDHLEIFSNGRYKSALHRVTVNSTKPRTSIASLHSLPFDHVVRPSPELVSEESPRLYMDTDFSSFLSYLSTKELANNKSFLESRKLSTTDRSRH